ncbi:piggyBac transposable element-derived protein 4-like [Pecten maximus]|uniref:piggyBac transposable element-derived protein 4-like n=1 Tax=Pecten maximus TaxID=6579 RepID=UPI001458F1D8|nr:piggyBac transposable element-derived protein 4-like [Pecten maximus]
MMGVRRLPRLSNYWSTDVRFSDPYISSILTKGRFLQLNKYIHLRDTSNMPDRNDPGYDPLFKVRTMIDMIVPKLKENYIPGQKLSIDEEMIGFKGQVHFKQYMSAKSRKCGIKVWQICDVDTAYCCNFQIYSGKKHGADGKHGLGYDVVWSLSEPYHNQNRHLYFDRFFSSVTLAEHLERVNTYVCGTIMSNREGIPDDVKKAKLKTRGELVQMQKGNLLATAFKDKKTQITFLSTSEQPHMNVNKPHVNVSYDMYMGSVDRFHQMESYYPVGRPGNKWWRYVMWYIVNLAVVNAWILYKKTEKKVPTPKKYYDHLQFRVDVADQLRAGFTSRKHRAGIRRSTKEENHPVLGDHDISHHKLVRIEGRKRVCRECVKQGRKTPKGRAVETSFMCQFCTVPLCRVGCFTDYHDRN